ncbi:MAG: sigma-70 family RNA polymerase sigma factor [Lachnospiraceae bacterium]|nr:sigma-70 family RNA polymerase sigma factor [Lachnospiraceae bacterium]
MSLFLAAIENEEVRSVMEIICEEYLEDMIRAANSILHNEQDALDAVQNAFLRMLNHADVLRGLTDHQTKWYVVTAAFNAAKDVYRIRKKQNEIPISDGMADADQFENYETKDQVERMILKLSAKDQEFLILRHVYGLKYAEIGKMQDLSEEAVRKTVKRAEAKLEEMCKEEQL